MKMLKRIMLLALALIMSLSLFACQNNNDGPNNNDDPNNNNVQLQAPDILDYVFDAQILKDNTLSVEFKDEPNNVVFVESSSNEYDADYTIEGKNVNLVMEESLLKATKSIKFLDSKENKFATINIMVNPITKNYYNVDADTESLGYKLVTAGLPTDVKFNGEEIGEGITVSETGIHFAKSLFSGDTMGHNKVEYVYDGIKYVVSVCAVTQSQLINPITFEDGKVSPFVYVYTYGQEAKVVDIYEQKGSDGVSPLVDPAKPMRYYIQADGVAEVENRKQLAIKGNSVIYVASFYLNARVAQLETRAGFDKWDDNQLYSLTAKGFSGTTNEWIYEFFSTESGETATEEFAYGKWYSDGANYTTILDYDMYNCIRGENGEQYIVCRVPMGKGGYMYIDDIGATLDGCETHKDANGGTMWFGGNSLVHCQNVYDKVTQETDYKAFRLLMDKVHLED